MATAQGVYSASVVENRDPENLARVLVRVSGLPEATGTVDLWARVATMMAGRNRGTWFIPDVGDEVLVAFERGDVKAPYVLGSLWNGKARPPAEPAAVKLIRSRNGMTIRLRDDNTSVVIETPGGQRITLQDGPGSVRVEDATGNAVTLAAAGVTVGSATTVTVNASARVVLSASIVEINGTSVTINAPTTNVNGVLQCQTLMSNSVIASSYSPGSGNVM